MTAELPAAHPEGGTVVTVLVADIDQPSRRLAAAALRHAGYAVELARTSKEAFSLLRRRRFGAVVVDPAEVPAVDVVQDLRRRTDIPIIVVSHLSERDRVAVLNAGADDYLSKPFGVEELLARLGAALRRAGPVARAGSPVATADFTVDLAARRLWRTDGSEVFLTPTEWRIVEALVRRPGFVVGHAELLEEVWGSAARTKPEYLRVYFAAIRKKTEPDPTQPRYFITYPGIGHVFLPEGPPGPRLLEVAAQVVEVVLPDPPEHGRPGPTPEPAAHPGWEP
jgi:two-component system, OmpR family, KDP operon response regulator KdpE